MNNNLILVGFMGSGKTTIARNLSKQLQCKWVDTDKLIETQSGKRIQELFDISEGYFRSWEKTICHSLQRYKQHIISTGGGILTSKDCQDLLKKCGIIVFLDISEAAVLERLKNDTKRPLLQTKDPETQVKALLNKRYSDYVSCADLHIKVDTLTIEEICSKIQSFLKEPSL